ncbi:MAG: hypothetical protein ACI9U0_000698 [Flavobacteriales bacterium]
MFFFFFLKINLEYLTPTKVFIIMMLIGLVIKVIALVFPFLHFRYGNTVFKVLGLIGAGMCCFSLIGIVMHFLQVEITLRVLEFHYLLLL